MGESLQGESLLGLASLREVYILILTLSHERDYLLPDLTIQARGRKNRWMKAS